MVETETSKLETHVKNVFLEIIKYILFLSRSMSHDTIDTQLCKLTREQV